MREDGKGKVREEGTMRDEGKGKVREEGKTREDGKARVVGCAREAFAGSGLFKEKGRLAF